MSDETLSWRGDQIGRIEERKISGEEGDTQFDAGATSRKLIPNHQ